MAYTITNLDTGEVTKSYTGDRRTAKTIMSAAEISELKKNLYQAEVQAFERAAFLDRMIDSLSCDIAKRETKDEIAELNEFVCECRFQVFRIEEDLQ